MIAHINEIKFPGKDNWTKMFNECSDHFIKSQDEQLSEKEKKEHFDFWFHKRLCLELGIY